MVYDPVFKYGQNFYLVLTEEAKERILNVSDQLQFKHWFTCKLMYVLPLLQTWPGLLEAWLVLTSVKCHGNLYILIPLNQRLALTRLRATGP